MYQIAVIGPIPKDHITTAKGKVIEKYGCVTHPAIALAKLLENKGSVLPIAHVRKTDKPYIDDLLKDYTNMSVLGIFSEADQGDIIELKFLDQNNRLEKQIGFMPPITGQDMEVALQSDIFVFVPITDYEVPLETIKYVKQNASSESLIVFDAHGPTTTVTTKGERYRRFWIERDTWLPYIDVLKMNIEEAGCCWFPKEFNPEDLKEEYQELSMKQMADFAQHVLNQGTKAVYITLDSRGCMVYFYKDEVFHAEFVRSVKVEEVIDTTGCGDSFAGGLAFGLLEKRDDYIKAAHYANALGALRTQGTTFEVFKSLEETEALIEKNYG